MVKRIASTFNQNFFHWNWEFQNGRDQRSKGTLRIVYQIGIGFISVQQKLPPPFKNACFFYHLR